MGCATEGNVKTYVSGQIVLAEPQTKDGLLGYRVLYPDGYISWSPKDVFEPVYREVTFGEKLLVVREKA